MTRGLNHTQKRLNPTLGVISKEANISANTIYSTMNDFQLMLYLQKLPIKQLEFIADMCFTLRIKKLKEGIKK